MRLAAIDVGTNSVHMIVVRVTADFSFEVIDREKEMVRLGAGGLDGRALTREAMRTGLQVLSKFRRLADSHGVDQIIAVATSAVREAHNGGSFLRAVLAETGLQVRVISGTEEARLIHMAASYGVGLSPRETAVVVDVGGGSVEITRGAGPTSDLARSFKVGVLRLTERFVKSDPLQPRDERKLVRHIEREMGACLNRIAAAGFDRLVGTSGTIESIGAIALAGRRRAAQTGLRGQRVAARDIRRVRKLLSTMDLSRRLRVPGLEPRRADLAVAGALLLDTVVRRLGATELTLCDLSLREGLVLDYIARHRREIAQADRVPDVRRRSVVELAQRCNYDEAHAVQVAHLALLLFDQTRSLHGLGDRQREWLEYAALLHDIGTHISYQRHHRHSEYLIRHGDLRGFDPEEVEAIALVARYHRRGEPKRRRSSFGQLGGADRRAVRTLAAMLRLAESLDRSHARNVERLALVERDGEWVLDVHVTGDAELEVWAASRQVRPFERLLGASLRIDTVRDTYAEQPPHEVTRVSGQALRGGGDRRLGQDHAARAAGQVAGGRGPSGLRHRMELVGAGQGGHQDGQEEERPDAHDLQPAARDRLRRSSPLQDRAPAQGRDDRAGRSLRVHRLRP
jgi:exopolyphosphatase/guanosine-5'-triphosphate,3'-diphosphate pyrophosphatase